MPAVASTKFTQAGGATDIAGRAVIGVLDPVMPANDEVTITNGSNIDVVSWDIDLLYVPPGSALVPGVLDSQVNNTPLTSFTPDVPGSYRCRLVVRDGGGTPDTDIRNFSIRTHRGVVVPPYQKNPDPLDLSLKDDELNFGGQAFGWAGDKTVGLFEQYFETYRDDAIATVDFAASPFTAAVNEADLYLVDATGGPIVFNLPATGVRVGQRYEIRDTLLKAFLNNITVNLPGADTFEDTTTSRVIYADGGGLLLEKVAATSWRVLKATSTEDFIPILAAERQSMTMTFTRLSAFVLNPDRYPDQAKFVLEVITQTDNAADEAEVKLDNFTTTTTVHTFPLEPSMAPVVLSTVLGSPADLAAGQNIYELYHRTPAGTATVTTSGAHLRVVYTSAG